MTDPELTHAGPFQRTSLGYAGGTGGYAYSFGRGGRLNTLYSISGEDQLARSGELVAESDASVAIADTRCDTGSLAETDDLSVLKHVRGWPPHARLAQHGLPPRKP